MYLHISRNNFRNSTSIHIYIVYNSWMCITVPIYVSISISSKRDWICINFFLPEWIALALYLSHRLTIYIIVYVNIKIAQHSELSEKYSLVQLPFAIHNTAYTPLVSYTCIIVLGYVHLLLVFLFVCHYLYKMKYFILFRIIGTI